MSVDKSEEKCTCNGFDCNCEDFSMRIGERARAKFYYGACVVLLAGASFFVAWASIVNEALWDFALLIVAVVDFALFFWIAMTLPEKYDRVCTEYKVYYRDIGLPRMKRKYVMVIDIMIAAVPLMFVVWDVSHTIAYIGAGVGPSDEILFMYFWPLDDWNMIAQGWLDFWWALLGLILFVSEFVVWFDLRGGNLCSARFDDVPFPLIGDYERRVETLPDYYWEKAFGLEVPSEEPHSLNESGKQLP